MFRLPFLAVAMLLVAGPAVAQNEAQGADLDADRPRAAVPTAAEPEDDGADAAFGASGGGTPIRPRQTCEGAFDALDADAKLNQRVQSFGPTLRRNLRRFIDVARSLHRAGYPEACVVLLDAVRGMIDRGAVMTAAARADALNEQEHDLTGVAARPDRTADASDAAPLGPLEGRIDSRRLVGAEARYVDGRPLGSVEGFLTEGGLAVSHLVVSQGGFFGIGERQVAVPVDRLLYDVVENLVFIDADEAWLERRPDLDPEGWFAGPAEWTAGEDAAPPDG